MDLGIFFQSLVEQDRCPVVICDLEHVILYMNPAALSKYAKRGGAGLIGKSLLDCHGGRSRELIQKVVDWFSASKEHNILYTFHNEKENKDIYMVALRDANGTLVGYYEKHEYRTCEPEEPYHF